MKQKVFSIHALLIGLLSMMSTTAYAASYTPADLTGTGIDLEIGDVVTINNDDIGVNYASNSIGKGRTITILSDGTLEFVANSGTYNWGLAAGKKWHIQYVEITDGPPMFPIIIAQDIYLTQVESNPALTLDEATDNSTALSTANGKVCDVTLTRTLQTGGYNTFAVPFAISSAKMTELGITAKKLTASEFNSTTGTLTLTFSSASEIEAGKPYLVKVSANVVNPTFSGVTVSSTAVPNTETAAVNFVPTLGKALVTGDGSYASEPGSVLFLGSGNKLFSPTVVNDAEQEASYMKGFRAYFQLKGETALARSFRIDFGDGETTGIISVNGSGLMVNGYDGCYDLLGRRIEGQPTQKGVYIVNGKKTVIK